MSFQLPFPTSTTPRGGAFGSKVLDNGKPRANWHRGHDFAPGADKPIPAIADGKVVDEGYSHAVGYWVEIKHGEVYATYCHMRAESRLREGDRVDRGDTVGHVGSTGNGVTGAHLHLAMSVVQGGGLAGNVIDPVAYIIRHPVVSKPPKPPVTVPTSTPSSSSTSYVVRAGDTLSKIAAKFKTTWQKLYALNKARIGRNPNVLKVGTKLSIGKRSSARKYTVKPGDSLSSIAGKYGVTWQALYAKNRRVIGRDPNALSVGKVLVIP